MTFEADPKQTCDFCQGDTVLASENAKLEADARALWAVRVLDAWAKEQLGRRWCVEIADEDAWRCKLFGTSIKAGEHYGPTPDAARIAAAEALVAETWKLEDQTLSPESERALADINAAVAARYGTEAEGRGTPADSACRCGCPRGKYRDGCACQCHDSTL